MAVALKVNRSKQSEWRGDPLNGQIAHRVERRRHG